MTAVLSPAIEITADGTALPSELLRRLISIRVATRLSQPAQGELSFATWPGTEAELDRVPLGAIVTISTDAIPLFRGEVTAVELSHAPDGATEIRIRCYDQLHRLRKRQQLRVFESVTLTELAQQLTADLGITVSAEQGPRWERIVQHRQRDLELLTEFATRSGRYPVLDGDTLNLLSLNGSGDPVALNLGTTLLDTSIEANLDRAHTTVTAYGWHPQNAEPYQEKANAVSRDIPLQSDATQERTLVDQPGRATEELAALAQSTVDTGAASLVTATGTAIGDPRLKPGARIDITGVAAQLRGRYVITEAVHTLDATGYLTTFSTAPPPQPDQPQASTVTLGTVSAVNDPENLGRVQISLPAHGDLDAGWLAVVCPGAGQDKGIVALPDTGDTVLVLLPHGIPAEGIVLGSLYGTTPPPDPGVDGGNIRRWSVHTPGGHKIILDDSEKTITVTDPTGSHLTLAPDTVTLHAATDLVIEAPGRAVTVRAATIDFEQG